MKTSVYDFEDYPGCGARAAAMEAAGYDTLVPDEGMHDPFVRAAVVAEHTQRVEIQTGIAVAFARSPMTLALCAHDLNVMSQGRFRLGLGSQIKAHITRRFSMPWSRPAARMREMIAAIHAIWDCWYDGKPLDFRGEFCSHTLMTPYFTPPNRQYGRPPIDLAAVGPLMTQIAAECADGMIFHSFTTPQYIRDVTLPVIDAALARRQIGRDKFELSGVPFMITGETEEALAASRATIRSRVAFYGSTPAYRAVLDFHGWGALHEELHALSRQGRWDDMNGLIDDEVLDAFAVSGCGREVVAQLRQRFGGIFDRMAVPFDAKGEALAELLAALKAPL